MSFVCVWASVHELVSHLSHHQMTVVFKEIWNCLLQFVFGCDILALGILYAVWNNCPQYCVTVEVKFTSTMDFVSHMITHNRCVCIFVIIPNLIQSSSCIIMSWSKKISLLQGHSEGFIQPNYDFLLCLVNCWSFYNQTWFNGISWIVFWKG